MDDMFAPVRDAGITQGDLAVLCDVCRLTANKWMRGTFKPHKLHADKVLFTLERVRLALQDGLLPVSPRLKGKARHEAVLAAVRAV